MNNFDTSKWKTFTIKELFTWDKGKYLSSADKNDYKGSIPCINGSSLNNGLLTFLDRSIEEKHFKLQKAPCLSLSRVGNAGLTFVQPRDFYIADNAYALKLKNITGNVYIYLFISTVLNLETKKYSYGRIINSKYLETKIKLPADANGQPDWLFMENFIKNKYIKTEKRITTKIKHKELPFDTTKWKSFKLGNLFTFKPGKIVSTEVLSEGNDLFYCGAKKDDNGVIGKYAYDAKYVSPGNCMVFICDGQGSIGYNNYMDKDFFATVNLVLGYNEHLNKYIGLFVTTVLDLERPKFSFGRKRKKTLSDTNVKLPADKNGNPDWDYMEKYIKSLPYSDLI